MVSQNSCTVEYFGRGVILVTQLCVNHKLLWYNIY